MNKIVKLPSGETVTIIDAKGLTHGDRKKILAATRDKADFSVAERGFAMNDALLAIIITEWSFDLIPPNVKAESLDKLSPADYDALSAEADVAMGILFPGLSKTDETDADPKATTENLSDSEVS